MPLLTERHADLISWNAINVYNIEYIYFRLLELGYERDVAQIINSLKSQCPDPPQTVLLSATLSEGKRM